jgi:hypothetical protein
VRKTPCPRCRTSKGTPLLSAIRASATGIGLDPIVQPAMKMTKPPLNHLLMPAI